MIELKRKSVWWGGTPDFQILKNGWKSFTRIKFETGIIFDLNH